MTHLKPKTMNNQSKYWLIGISCLFLTVCKNRAPEKTELLNGSEAENKKGVFVSGSIVKNGKRMACIWKNDTIQMLDESLVGAALDIFVTDSSILVGGESDGKPCYWHNGKKYMVALPGEGAVTGVYVQGGVLYAIGYVHEGPIRTRGFLLNGTSVNYLNSYSGYASDFVFDGSDIYIAGADEGRPCYWKNGVLTPLSERGDVFAIDVSKGKILVAGDNRRGALTGHGVWNDGQFEPISEAFHSLKKLKLYDGKVYLLGNGATSADKSDIASNGFMDKNGQLTVFKGVNENSSTVVNDIFINNSSIFVVGAVTDNKADSRSRICYWVDGKIHIMLSEQEALSSAIFVR